MDIVKRLTLYAARQPRTEGAVLALAAAEFIAASRKESKMTFQELESRVAQWASDRKIIPNSNPTAQLMKTMSELGELADATLKDDDPGIVDGLGDVLVTLIIYARLQNVSLIDCLASAYATIKNRRGYLTPDGIFVKED